MLLETVNGSEDRTGPDRRLARVAGVLYLVVIVCAGFAEGFVRSGLIEAGDAAATASNIAAAASLFRAGLVADLIAFMADAAVAILLYVLLEPVSRTLSMLAAAFRLLAHPAIAGVNLLNHYAALPLLTGADATAAFGEEQLNAAAMVFLELHRHGYLIGGAFFGVHCFLLGWLLYRSGYFPRVLGVLMVVASFGYLSESIGNFLLPAYAGVFMWLVAVPAVVAELSLTLYLIVKGVRVAPARREPVAAS